MPNLGGVEREKFPLSFSTRSHRTKKYQPYLLAPTLLLPSFLISCSTPPSPTQRPEELLSPQSLILTSEIENNPEADSLKEIQGEVITQLKNANFAGEFGQEIGIGVNKIDFLLTPFVNPTTHEPTGTGLATYQDGNEVTTRVVIEYPFTTEDGRAAASLFATSEEVIRKFLDQNNQPLAIRESDLKTPIVTFVLKEGENWQTLNENLSKNPNNSDKILSGSIEFVGVYNLRTGEIDFHPFSELPKSSQKTFLISFHPTPTPEQPSTPTPTETPTLTPTPQPTETPTPIPTFPPEQVGGLEGVPDPRITNPELFDLQKPDSPIPQFVNAMKEINLNLTVEEVLTQLHPQLETPEGLPPFITYRTEDGIALIMGLLNPQTGEWEWKKATVGEYWYLMGKQLGVSMDGLETKIQPFPNLAGRFFGNGGILALSGQVRPGPDIEERTPDNSASVRSFQLADNNNMSLLFHYVAEPGKYPNYISAENVDSWLDNRLLTIARLTKKYKNMGPIIIEYNEPFHPTSPNLWNEEREPLRDRYGERYLEEFVYRTLKIFMDQGLIPNRDFAIMINEDTPILNPNSITSVINILTSARNNAFQRLVDENYSQTFIKAGINFPEDLIFYLGLQMNKPDSSPGQIGNILNQLPSSFRILLTEITLYGNNLTNKSQLIYQYVSLVNQNPKLAGLVFGNVFVTSEGEDQQYPPTPFFEGNQPNFLYYFLLK